MLARCALLTLVLATACASPRALPRPAGSARLPSIDLVTLAGRPARLDTSVQGRVAVVSLWATWCTSCREELAALARVEQSVRGRGGIVIGVAVGEPRETVERFLRGQSAPRLQLVDERFHLADALGQDSVPATLVLDRSARVVFAGGALDEPALDALRDALR